MPDVPTPLYNRPLLRYNARDEPLFLSGRTSLAERQQNAERSRTQQRSRTMENLEDIVAALVEWAGMQPPGSRLADLLGAADEPEPDWVVERLLARKRVSLLGSRPKMGKSTLVRALALAT